MYYLPSLGSVSLLRLLSYVLVGASLSACGGGGGGSSSPPPVNQNPVAVISTGAVSGSRPFAVSFDGSQSSDGDGTIASYMWTFGDGATATGVRVDHTYDSIGEFQANLVVTDNDGATATQAREIAVTAVLSGTVSILGSSGYDRDVNDRFSTPESNNSIVDAQPLSNPVSLGGFANVAGTGPDTGQFFAAGDDTDVYGVSLTGNETILLTIGSLDADLDLELLDETGMMIDASMGNGSSMGSQQTESISLPDITPVPPGAGDYFVQVKARSGASNYVLTIGQDIGPTQTRRPATRLSDSFIAGELVVQSDDPRMAERHRLKRMSPATHGTPGRMGRYQLTENGPTSTRIPHHLQAKFSTLMALKALAADPRTICAEPNLIRRAQRTPNDTFYPRQWHYPQINLPLAWDITTGESIDNTDVIVAVVDTGVLLNHPDLSAQVVGGFDFISDTTRANDGDGIDANPDDPGDLGLGGRSSFHGTHVAGTVAAQSDNGAGVAGVAWDARIMPIRVLGVDGGSSFDVIQGVRYAAGLSNDSATVPPQRADIINLSLGGGGFSQAEQQTYDEVRAAGVIVVSSAGNESSSTSGYPAAYEGVVSVSATTIGNGLAPYSNFGSTIDVGAPGGNSATDFNADGFGDGVFSTIGDASGAQIRFGFTLLNGTSMASPHVAGVAALMKAVHPGLTPDEFDLALVAGGLTDDLGTPGRDNAFGYGLINAQKAVLTSLALAGGTGPDPGPILNLSTSTLNFGPFATQLPVTITNVGTGNPQITSVTADQPWLQVNASNVDTAGLGDYSATVDRTGLPDGAYRATITFASDATNITLEVAIQVNPLAPAPDAGLHYVVAVNPDNEVVSFTQASAIANGQYQFTLTDMPAGPVRIFAGTDSDDDDLLCTSGEACGAFRIIDTPEVVDVTDNVSGLDFLSTFRVSLTANSAQPNSGATRGAPTLAPLAIPKGAISKEATSRGRPPPVSPAKVQPSRTNEEPQNP